MKGFSVIMPTYNQSGFIKRAILSLYQQTYQEWELIIINDGCTDDTENYIEEYLSDKRVRYIKNAFNQGLGSAINQGLNIAQFDYITYLPSDDFYYNNQLQSMSEKLDEQGDAIMVISGIKYLDKDSCYQSTNYFSSRFVPGNGTQLVQTAHRKTSDRWVERTEFVSDDLFVLFWHKLIDKGSIAFTHQVTTNWTSHPHQRHKIITEYLGGGINYYRRYYQVHTPIKLQCKETIPIDEEKLYAPFRKPGNYTKDCLKILIIGELAYNPERIFAFEEQGHQLYGLWLEESISSFNTVGPLPFGNVTDIPYKNWREEVKKIQPDIMYALLNVRAIPLAHEVLMSGLNIPFVWHFKEGPSLSRQMGFWKKLIDLYSYSDGQIYIDPESKIWYEEFTSPNAQMPFILDGDLPKIDYFTDDFSPRISDTDGEIHTVAPGRVIGISAEELQELAKQRIHLHLYIQNYPRMREPFISMASAVMGDCFHLHSPCIPQDWVKEFSQYDAGWLHCFESRNDGYLTKVEWDDLNLPARMNTLAAAGLPMLQRNNQGHIVAMQSKVQELNTGICFDSYGQLGALLKNKELMQTLRENMLIHRYKFSFDYHVPALISFFRKIINKKIEKNDTKK
jgi:glycosyltransferase involved in cell wall biosynthesis